jgi:predicted DCC family thiol-disulfide oxidoreductase YuxK
VKNVRVYRNPACAKCARYARRHQRLDWLGRVDISTQAPRGHAPLRMGEVIVEDLRAGRLLEGADAYALLARQIPAYWPTLALLAIPAVRRRVDREMRADCTGSCELPS